VENESATIRESLLRSSWPGSAPTRSSSTAASAHDRRSVAEIAAQRRVELVLNEGWLKTMEEFFKRAVRHARTTRRAMLRDRRGDRQSDRSLRFALESAGALLLTPGVPRELRRMLEEQIIPAAGEERLQATIHLKRSFLRARRIPRDALSPAWSSSCRRSVKLGFRAHYRSWRPS